MVLCCHLSQALTYTATLLFDYIKRLRGVVMLGAYEAEWMQALARTERYGLPVPAGFSPQTGLLLTESKMRELSRLVEAAISGLTASDVVGQCLAIHFGLAPVVQRWLGCPIHFTLGWVDDGEDGWFRFGDKEIESLLENGHQGGPVSVHAWLTLPALEIIDATLPTSYAIVNNEPKGVGGLISQHADNLKGMAYMPVLVGHEFLRRSGLLRFEPLR